MRYFIGDQGFQSGTKYLTTELEDSSTLLGSPGALLDRLNAQGFLFVRGFHDREQVLRCRLSILRRLHDEGRLKKGTPLDEAVAAEGEALRATSSVRDNEALDSHLQQQRPRRNSDTILGVGCPTNAAMAAAALFLGDAINLELSRT